MSVKKSLIVMSPISQKRSSPTPKLQISITSTHRAVTPALLRWLKQNLQQAARIAGVHQGKISLCLLTDARMKKLHHQYLGLTTTTDVLSFDLRTDSQMSVLDTDLALCYDVACRQARLRGHPVKAELLLYAVHGMLHMLGHDDLTPSQARRMHAREEELLAALGWPGIYFSPETSDIKKKKSTRK